ncbi:MAG: ABC transporter ATP-binding protein [Alterinioella nitratireducens]|uniref:ABC transporter ATP-binding protein n=1 Tax=Alterinioella nitratireducens TaxID=2735915 RepID=UPI00405A04C6
MSEPSKNLLIRLWREHVVGFWRLLIVAFILMVIEGSTLGAISYLIQPLFDLVFIDGNSSAVTWVALAISGIFVLRAISGFGQRVLIVTIGLRVTTALQTRLLGHLLSLDARFFQDNAPGSLIERVRGDTQALQGVASATLMTIGRDTISVISLLTVMLISDWAWALLALAGVPILILPLSVLQKLIRKTTRAAREAAARLSTQLDEIFHGIISIKVNRLEDHEATRFDQEVDRFLDAQLRAERGKAANPAVIDVIAAIGFLAVLIYGGQQIIAGEKTVGEFMSFFTALALVFDPLRRLSAVSGHIQAALASLERLYSVLEARPTILPPASPKRLKSGDIRFASVSFSYGDTPVLRGFDLTAEEGRTTALVGPSGAGKSTVFSLLTRLIDPDLGEVSIAGTAIDAADLEELRNAIALVGQETALFDETIAQNIRLGRLDATDAQVQAAAEAAHVTDFADGLPLGLNTPVGPRGGSLSGGQRQRVAIARAMLRDAPILLLDEPTSALDARSEQLVNEALRRLSAGRTTLVIAHRLSTIRAADHIVVMDQGAVIEQGTHEALMARKGAYARLNQLQSAGLSAPL